MDKYAKIGDMVNIHFTGSLEDGTIFDSSVKNNPLRFVVGRNDVIQGIDDAIIGMKIGQQKVIHISSDKGYGAVERELIITIDKNELPKNLDVQLGQELQIPNEDGNPINVRITKITDTHIELDGNHPLAGKNLIFDLKLIKIE